MLAHFYHLINYLALPDTIAVPTFFWQVIYLTECYKRCCILKIGGAFKWVKKTDSVANDELINHTTAEIIQNLSTVFVNSFEEGNAIASKDVNEQFFGFFNDSNNDQPVVGNLLESLVKILQGDGYCNIADNLVHYILNVVKNEAQGQTLFGTTGAIFSRVDIFVQHPNIAKIFILYNYPKNVTKGSQYSSQTLLGILLSKGTLQQLYVNVCACGSTDLFKNIPSFTMSCNM